MRRELIRKRSQQLLIFCINPQLILPFPHRCFWEPSEELLKVEGVIDTVAGYTGNPSATKAPTYDSVCFSPNWVEGVRVQYDDEKISYSELLDALGQPLGLP